MAEDNKALAEPTYTRSEIERSIKVLFKFSPVTYPMPDGTCMEVKQDFALMFEAFWMLTDNMKRE